MLDGCHTGRHLLARCCDGSRGPCDARRPDRTGAASGRMAVDAVYDGAAALDATAQTAYDVIVLDRDLSGVHGDRVC